MGEFEYMKLMQLVKKSQTIFVCRKKSESIPKSDARTMLPPKRDDVYKTSTKRDVMSV